MSSMSPELERRFNLIMDEMKQSRNDLAEILRQVVNASNQDKEFFSSARRDMVEIQDTLGRLGGAGRPDPGPELSEQARKDAAEQVAAIISQAQESAQAMIREAEERAAEIVQEAEAKAQETLDASVLLRAQAEEDAEGIRSEAAEHARQKAADIQADAERRAEDHAREITRLAAESAAQDTARLKEDARGEAQALIDATRDKIAGQEEAARLQREAILEEHRQEGIRIQKMIVENAEAEAERIRAEARVANEAEESRPLVSDTVVDHGWTADKADLALRIRSFVLQEGGACVAEWIHERHPRHHKDDLAETVVSVLDDAFGKPGAPLDAPRSDTTRLTTAQKRLQDNAAIFDQGLA